MLTADADARIRESQAARIHLADLGHEAKAYVWELEYRADLPPAERARLAAEVDRCRREAETTYAAALVPLDGLTATWEPAKLARDHADGVAHWWLPHLEHLVETAQRFAR